VSPLLNCGYGICDRQRRHIFSPALGCAMFNVVIYVISVFEPGTSDFQHLHFLIPDCFLSLIPTILVRLAPVFRVLHGSVNRVLTVLVSVLTSTIYYESLIATALV
jgi:hypothetical protein